MLMINEKLLSLAEMLASHVPTATVTELRLYVDAGEAEVGLEQLCDTLSDEEEPLTPEEAALIREIGTQLGLTRPSFLEIDELVVDP
jgi:hypothetical protein